MRKQGIAFTQWSNHLDHLAPICELLDIPVIVDTPELAEIAAQFYPGLRVRLEHDPKSDALIDYEVVFHATRVPRSVPREVGFPRHMRFVHCPHGWSDKVWWNKWMALEDVTLIYGDAQLRLFEEYGTAPYLKSYVRAGNYRYRYYLEQRKRLDRLVAERVYARLDPHRATILYTPTWNDIDSSSSFFAACAPMIEQLPKHYQLIIKIHPLMDYQAQARVDQLIASCSNRHRVVCLKEFPLVFPLLSCAAIYIGDRSSVGYDYLAFRRPMFFLKTEDQRHVGVSRLDACGTAIHESQFGELYDVIDRAMGVHAERFLPAQSEMWKTCFEPIVPGPELAAGIEAAVASERDDDSFEVPAELQAEKQRQLVHLDLHTRERWLRLLPWRSR